MAKAAVITLPDDDKLIAALRLKLEEYKQRCNSLNRTDEQQLSTFFKIVILKELFKNREVNTKNFAQKWEKSHPKLWENGVYYYHNACNVINDYITTGGKHTYGGTGLPELPE